jgi:hypothetical protein
MISLDSGSISRATIFLKSIYLQKEPFPAPASTIRENESFGNILKTLLIHSRAKVGFVKNLFVAFGLWALNIFLY